MEGEVQLPVVTEHDRDQQPKHSEGEGVDKTEVTQWTNPQQSHADHQQTDEGGHPWRPTAFSGQHQKEPTPCHAAQETCGTDHEVVPPPPSTQAPAVRGDFNMIDRSACAHHAHGMPEFVEKGC